MELERLSALDAAHWDKAMQGNGEATDRVLRIMERRAKLLGLDAPIKVNVERTIRELARERGLTEEETERALAEAAEIIRQTKQQGL